MTPANDVKVSAVAESSGAATKHSIFIVDDDQFLLEMYALKFTQSGFAVDSCLSSTQALTKFAEGPSIDILLLDIVMPQLDGFGVLAKIKEKKLLPNTKIIILSNLGQKEDIEKGLSLGADGYIIKASSTPSEVVEKVLAIVGTSK